MTAPDDTPSPDSGLARRVRIALDQRPSPPNPAAAQHRVRALFTEAFGVSAEASAFAPTYVPLSGEHTAYFDGLALLLRLPGGVAVAVGQGPSARLAIQHGDVRPRQRALDADAIGWGADAGLARVVRALWHAWDTPSDLIIAVHLDLPVEGQEALLGGVAAAVGQGLDELIGGAREVPVVGAQAVSEALGRPFGPAPLVAAANGRAFVLVDTATQEAEALQEPEHMGWGLVDTGRESNAPSAFYKNRLASLDSAVTELRNSGFDGIRSLRGIDHRALPDALDQLRGEAKRVVRHLASEDRRVQRLLVALKKGDGQIVGAHLLMSFASWRDDWQASTPEAEFVVGEVEKAEGIYGARPIGGGFGGGLLVVGRPFLVPPFLDALAERFAAQFGIPLATLVL